MATVIFFGGPALDKDGRTSIDLEIGSLTVDSGAKFIYLNDGDNGVLLSERDGRAFCKAVADLARSLGY